MSGSWSSGPTLAGFTSFVQNAMGLPTQVIPADSPWFQWMLDRALALVITVPGIATADYTNAVYNCGGHLLLAHYPAGTDNEVVQKARKQFGLNEPSSGVVASSSDQGTSETLAVPDALQQLTISDLGFFRTPYGREYLAYQQDFGGIFGIS